jgi:TonB family protein
MKGARSTLLALSMLASAGLAVARTPAQAATQPEPIDSPGEWIGPGDYPVAALRFEMTGTTAFRLTVDGTGQPSRCDIVESSGFDMLDAATCERVMAKARFSPARDRAGKPVEGRYSNRVRWALPEGPQVPGTEQFVSMRQTIDQTGTITSCHATQHVPDTAAAGPSPCDYSAKLQQPAVGLNIRGDFQGPSAEVEILMANVFTPELRARVLSPKAGYEQRGLNIHRFTVGDDRKISQCVYEEQRGSALLATHFCQEIHDAAIDPPFSAFDKDGTATGWRIVRVLLKTGA